MSPILTFFLSLTSKKRNNVALSAVAQNWKSAAQTKIKFILYVSKV